MGGANYLEVLEQHMLPMFIILYHRSVSDLCQNNALNYIQFQKLLLYFTPHIPTVRRVAIISNYMSLVTDHTQCHAN